MTVQDRAVSNTGRELRSCLLCSPRSESQRLPCNLHSQSVEDTEHRGSARDTKNNDLKEVIQVGADVGVRCGQDEQEIDRFLGWCDQEVEALDKDRDATLHDEVTWEPKCNKGTLRSVTPMTKGRPSAYLE